MKKQILFYNIMTPIFAILTLVSVGGLLQGEGFGFVVLRIVFFAHLTILCFNKESLLRTKYKKLQVMKRRRKHILLENYKTPAKKELNIS